MTNALDLNRAPLIGGKDPRPSHERFVGADPPGFREGVADGDFSRGCTYVYMGVWVRIIPAPPCGMGWGLVIIYELCVYIYIYILIGIYDIYIYIYIYIYNQDMAYDTICM